MQLKVLVSLSGALGGSGGRGWEGCCIRLVGKASPRGQRLLRGPLQSREEILCRGREPGSRTPSSGSRCRRGRPARQAPRPPRPLDPRVGLAGALLPPVGAVLDAPPAQQDQLDRARNPTSVKRQKAVQVAEGGQLLLLAQFFCFSSLQHFLNFHRLNILRTYKIKF